MFPLNRSCSNYTCQILAAIVVATQARGLQTTQLVQQIKVDGRRVLSHTTVEDEVIDNGSDPSLAEEHTCSFGIDRLKKGEGLKDYLDILGGSEQFVDDYFPLVDAIRWDDMPEHAANDMSSDEKKVRWKRISDEFSYDNYSLYGSDGVKPSDAL